MTAERLGDLRDVKVQISGDITKVHVDRRRRVRQRVDMIERGVCGDAGGLGDDGADDAVNGFGGACGTDTAEGDADDDGVLQAGRGAAQSTRRWGRIYSAATPAWGSRAASSPQTIARALEKLQPALQKSRIDRATTRPTAEGWS